MKDIFIIRCKILLVFIARYLNIQNLYNFFYTVKEKKNCWPKPNSIFYCTLYDVYYHC